MTNSSDVRIGKLHIREASRMGAPWHALNSNRPGYGVFVGFPMNTNFREQWCATKAEAEALANEWTSQLVTNQSTTTNQGETS